MESTYTLCSLCQGPTAIRPNESYIPLCDACKERLFPNAERTNTRDYLEKELSMLRSMSSKSLLLAAWQLYDNRLLQVIASNDDNDLELHTLIKEADVIYYAVGRSMLPVLFHQLALHFYHVGWIEDATSLLHDTIGGLHVGYLLYHQPEDYAQFHLSIVYTHLAMIHADQTDPTRQITAITHAMHHLRKQISICVKQLDELEQYL